MGRVCYNCRVITEERVSLYAKGGGDVIPIAQFLSINAISFLISLLSNMSINTVILLETFYLSRTRANWPRFWLGNLLISMIMLVPVFVAHYLSFPDLDYVPYTVLVYPPPLVLPLYYWVYRRVMGVSRQTSLMYLELVLLAQYLTMVIYQLLNAIWTSALGSDNVMGLRYADLLAMLTTSPVVWGAHFLLRRAVRRTGYYLQLPFEYPEQRIWRDATSMGLTCSINYLMLVFSCIMMIVRRQLDATPHVLAVYTLLLALQTLRLLDQYLAKRMRALGWQAHETQIYTDSLLRVLEEFRGLRHDFGNILQGYGGYISVGDLDGLSRYHQSIIKTMTDVGGEMALAGVLSERMALHNLLTIKLRKAAQKGIHVELYGTELLGEAAIDDLDLCRIMGNLLDNAVEAAEESADKRILLKCQREDMVALEVVVGNSMERAPSVEQLFDLGYTTKESHAGRGLVIVQSILKERNCGSLRVRCEDGWFTAHLLLRTRS